MMKQILAAASVFVSLLAHAVEPDYASYRYVNDLP